MTVEASDPGVDDVLTYSFDCNGDGSYEVGPQPGDTTTCALDPAQASTTISVLVADDDGGMAEGAVEVAQTVTLCRYGPTGRLSAPGVSGCAAGTFPLVLPGAGPMTLCINFATRSMTWSPTGMCAGSTWPHIVPDSGPLSYCHNLWTNELHFSWNGECGAYEVSGVIPG